MLIRAYRVRGHLEANLDPLGLKPKEPHAELDPRSYGFTEADMDRPIFIDNVLGRDDRDACARSSRSCARPIAAISASSSCISRIRRRSAWIQDRIEAVHNQTEFTERGKRAILERLTAAEMFERFLDRKYTGTKRFGLDGGEVLRSRRWSRS